MRHFKVIRNGRTTTSGTHDAAQAARALLDARKAGDDLRLVVWSAQGERPLTADEQTDIVARATRIAVAG